MASDSEILDLIPHRPPFLWVDRIVSMQEQAIETEKTVPADLDVFQGHYPDYPIMPGVLLCEVVFQSGALLLGALSKAKKLPGTGIPVLTRIINARFKREVRPGDHLQVHASIAEIIGNAFFMKGLIKSGGKTVLKVEFCCAMVDR